MDIRDSSTYQAALDEGRKEGRREGMLRFLLRQGQHKLGPPSDASLVAFTAITDLDRFERIADRMLNASSWDELLATP